MFFRNTRSIAFAVAGALLMNLAACSSKVEQAAPKEIIHQSARVRDVDENGQQQEATDQTVTNTITTTTETTTTTTTTTFIKGNVYDIKGNTLLYSEVAEDGSINRKMNETYKVSEANVMHPLSSGFDSVFEEILRTKNPTPANDTDTMGQSLQITIDSDVQNEIYQYMQSQNLVGSVVAMRTDGSIMAEVSYPSYDPDLYAQDKDYGDNLAWGAFGNKAFQNAAPGSCFKILSEIIADKNGISSLYDEGTWIDDGGTIVNWDHDTNYYYPMQRDLCSAFINSSNIFFAKVFDQVGTEKVLADLSSIFHFGNADCNIDCDFGPIENNIEITCKDDLRRSAFGQAMVRTCPIYLAAVGREAVFGDMVRPFVLKRIVDTTDSSKTISNGSAAYDVIGSVPANCRDNILAGMSGVAANIGLYAPGNYQVYCKTGTAEVGAGDYLYITGVLKNYGDRSAECIEYTDYSDYAANGGSYILVMQMQNPSEHNFNYASESAHIYQGLINIVAGR